MKYLRVKNWDQFQHYKKRSPPWIKLHRELINDYAFMSLKDQTKAHLMLIWVLAAGSDGLIAGDAKFIEGRIGATSAVDIETLIASGFLVEEEGPDIATPHKGNGKGKFDDQEETDESPVIETIPCVGDTSFAVHQSFVTELERLYPGVDVPQTLREIRGWCIGNPTKRKTMGGARRFITSWLAREQNKPS